MIIGNRTKKKIEQKQIYIDPVMDIYSINEF